MWIPFAVLLGLFSLLVGGITGHKIAQNECQAFVDHVSQTPVPPAPVQTDSQTQR